MTLATAWAGLRRTAMAGAATPALGTAALADDVVSTMNVPANPAALAVAPFGYGARPQTRPAIASAAPMRPRARDPYLPNTRWQEEGGASRALWTRAMMSALEAQGAEIDDVIPADIGTWCPAYAGNSAEERRAFWVGLMSAVAWYESRFIPDVVGGGNLYYGLTQILPSTARAVGCRAGDGSSLLSPEANLSCAVRIMAVVVPDHQAVARVGGRNRGIASQWGPMTHGWAREEMAAWTREQDYCRIEPILVDSAPRPPARPEALPLVTRNSPVFD
mgnify:CR=1 FL=1